MDEEISMQDQATLNSLYRDLADGQAVRKDARYQWITVL